MVADNINHNGACLQMNTGEQAFSRPSLGSWLTYGLGSENQNLPGFVVISPAQPSPGRPLWGSSFLPAAYQGTWVADLKNPIANLQGPARTTPAASATSSTRSGRLNELHKHGRDNDSRLERPDRLVRAGLPHAVRAPEAFDMAARRRDHEALWPRRPADRDFRPAVPDGPAAGRARRAVRAGLPHVQGNNAWDQHSGLRRTCRTTAPAPTGRSPAC